MALQSSRGDIPKDAVALTRSEAVDYQWTQIINWPNRWDVWPFKWGLTGIGVIASATGAYINGHYRKKLKLRNFGFVTTQFPMIIAPAMFAVVLHISFVTNNLFLQDVQCPLCMLYRASIVQLGCSIVYPIVLSPIANFSYAIRHATYRLPYMTDYKGNLKVWLDMTRPLGKRMLVVGGVQMASASYLTFAEAESLYKIRYKFASTSKNEVLKELVATD